MNKNLINRSHYKIIRVVLRVIKEIKVKTSRILHIENYLFLSVQLFHRKEMKVSLE